jgi:branched-chain amino acid transport system substrate-binding protein
MGAVASATVALGAGLAACGGSDGEGGDNGETTTLTIYSSLPLQGATAGTSKAIVNGEKLALAQAGGRVGKFTIKYQSLDDSKPATGRWDAGQTAASARRAVQDQSTIAYIGDFDSEASAISIPILNSARILQISPASTHAGLTRADGADKGEPEKYYTSGERTFGRVVPADGVQAAAQVAYQRAQGCRRLFVVHDQAFGAGLARLVVRDAPGQGLRVLGRRAIRPAGVDVPSLALRVRATGADCLFFAGSTENGALELWREVHRVAPAIKLFGGSAVAEPGFTSALPPSAQRVTYVTRPTLAPDSYPPAGRRFFRDYRNEFGESPDPYALLGYEAMRVVLTAIRMAGRRGDDRQAVINAFFRIRDRRSPLGTYSIDVRGDTTLSYFGAYRVRDGGLVFDRVLRLAGAR